MGADNGPLREGKGSTFEGGYRVPMFFHWPDNVPSGVRFDHPVTALDFYPTFAGLAHAKIPDGKQLDGKDIWQNVVAGSNPRAGETIFAMRHRDGFSDVGIRHDQWKACRAYNAPWKLFDLASDIGETRDLSAKYPDMLRQMVAEAERWSHEQPTPKWFDNLKAENKWKTSGMPHFDQTFRVQGD